jgi:syntaxin 16
MTTIDRTKDFLEYKKNNFKLVKEERDDMPVDYVVYFTQIDEELSKINKLCKESEKIFGNLFMSAFDKEQIEQEYKDKIREINEKIMNLKQLFGIKKDIGKKYSSDHESKIIENIYKQKIMKFECALTIHQKNYNKYIKYLKSLNKLSFGTSEAEIGIKGLDSDSPDRKTAEDESNYIKSLFPENNFTDQLQSQINPSVSDHELLIIEERNREIQELQKTVMEVAELFKDLSLMINEQSETIERIDQNIENSLEKTQKGVEELLKTEEIQKKSCCIQ